MKEKIKISKKKIILNAAYFLLLALYFGSISNGVCLFISYTPFAVFNWIIFLTFIPILVIINFKSIVLKVIVLLIHIWILYVLLSSMKIFIGEITDIQRYYSPESNTEIVVQTRRNRAAWTLTVFKKEHFYYKLVEPNNFEQYQSRISMQKVEDDDTKPLDGKVNWVDDDTFIIEYYHLEDSDRYEAKEYIFEI